MTLGPSSGSMIFSASAFLFYSCSSILLRFSFLSRDSCFFSMVILASSAHSSSCCYLMSLWAMYYCYCFIFAAACYCLFFSVIYFFFIYYLTDFYSSMWDPSFFFKAIPIFLAAHSRKISPCDDILCIKTNRTYDEMNYSAFFDLFNLNKAKAGRSFNGIYFWRSS